MKPLSALLAPLLLCACAVQPTPGGINIVADNDAVFGSVVREYALANDETATLRRGTDRRHFTLRLNRYFSVAEIGRFDNVVPEFDTELNADGGGREKVIVLRTASPGCERGYLILRIHERDVYRSPFGNCREPLNFEATDASAMRIAGADGRFYLYAQGRLNGPFAPQRPVARSAEPAKRQTAARPASRPQAAGARTDLPSFGSVNFSKAESHTESGAH